MSVTFCTARVEKHHALDMNRTHIHGVLHVAPSAPYLRRSRTRTLSVSPLPNE